MPLIRPQIDYGEHLLHEKYDESLWSDSYQYFNRYLIDLSDSQLEDRYTSILRNQISLVSPRGDLYPINNVWRSSWFWFRKQVENETEFRLREKEIPKVSLDIDLRLLRAQIMNQNDSRKTDSIFVRYGELFWIEDMLQHGRVRIKHASVYLGAEMNQAQRDDELTSSIYSPGHNVIVKALDQDKKIPVIGSLTYQTRLNLDCFILCGSNEFDPLLWHDFPDYDACLIIQNLDEFARRLDLAWKTKHGECVFTHNNIEYYDQRDTSPILFKNDLPLGKQIRNPIASKSFTFAYQREYRFWWASQIGSPRMEMPNKCYFTDLTVGCLEDIAKIVRKCDWLNENA
jgi:hypothetical protein